MELKPKSSRRFPPLHLILFMVLMVLFCSACETLPQTQSDTELPPNQNDPTLTDILKEQASGEELLPQNYKTIYIDPFINGSSQAEIISSFQNRLYREFSLNSRLTPTNDPKLADVVLQGKLTMYKEIPRDHDSFGQVVKYDLSIMATILVRTGHRQNLSMPEKIIQTRERIRYDTSYVTRGSTMETKILAQQRLFDGLSRRILLTVFSGWYTEDKTMSELNYNPDSDTEVIDYSNRTDLSNEDRKKLEEQAKKNQDLNRKPHQ